MSDICIVCAKDVRPRQHGVSCDFCHQWQHRTCDTGISLAQYRAAVQSGDDIPFTCQRCERRNPTTDQHGATFVVQTSLLSEATEIDSTRDTTHDTMDESQDDNLNDSFNESNVGMNRPFNIQNHPIVDEPEIAETTLPDEPLSETLIEEQPVVYTVFEQGSKRGKPLLVGSDGFRYYVKKSGKSSVLWSCSSRSVKCKCYASVVQKGNDFARGTNAHQHGPEPSLDGRIRVSIKVREEARAQPYKSTSEIGKDARREFIQPNQPGVPIASSLARQANRYREKFRPAEPKDLDFVVDVGFLKCQDFLVADIQNGTARHLIFATREQLDLLSTCKRWFMDGTFRVVGEPFKSGQLESIHGFIRNNDGTEKQVPMAFILMSRRRTEDYVKVLTSLKESLDQVVVENVVMDFEQAAWLAVRQVFPGATIKGCVFHYTQSVWRKVQDVGLKPAYSRRASIYNYVRQLLGLPFLPYTHIEPAFRELATRANSEPLRDLIAYMDYQWMNHPIFTIESWSVYGLTIRTNNDCEGWHNRLNRKAGGMSLSFYRLVPALRSEAEAVSYELRHIRDGISTRRVRPAARSVEEKIRELWDKYAAGTIETSVLLEGCAAAYGPQVED